MSHLGRSRDTWVLTVNPRRLKSLGVSPMRDKGLPEPLVTRSDSNATFRSVSKLSTRF